MVSAPATASKTQLAVFICPSNRYKVRLPFPAPHIRSAQHWG